ncbi:MAG TPA: bifunctional transaldolase/phosoglucose isomerase [Candidatus Limnocylindrales bacterium]|nr:bifunctional transaldolase/phosoglucose isomerase [Candidatus Limnocylindrales bacterium]
MAKNPLWELYEAGTSVWLDNMRRSLVTSGELQRLIDEDAVVGMTSNPTIFEKAIGGSADYDDSIRTLIAQGLSGDELMLSLIIEDIQMAADVLRPVYDRTKRVDGYISIEVLPSLAYDTQGTIKMAHDLSERVGRPNIFVKIPATQEGLPAIEQCLFDGVNINITLLFSVKVYEQVARAYLSAMRRRLRAGKPVDVASVASFFVSRVDTAVDKLLQAKIDATADPAEKARLQRLLGKAAIANAKMAYKKFLEIFHSAEFDDLRQAGAWVQRCLWASTGTKNPAYSDVMYVEELIGPETVNTMPDQTLKAFKEHGEVRQSLTENMAGAEQVLHELAELGIDMDQVTHDLEVDGVKLFADSVTRLLSEIEDKKKRLSAGPVGAHEAKLGALEAPVNARLTQLERDAAVRRIWEKDATLWKADPAAQKEIKERLGWLEVVTRIKARIPELTALRDTLLKEGCRDAVLLGMGGSSLAPEVFRRTFGEASQALRLHVLDTTDPAAIAELERAIPIDKTVFIVASKSGTTLETLSHYHYFWEKTRGRGSQFLAITDPGTPLAQDAQRRGFRQVFLNPPDIGGRYSALSCFGLVPAALAGVDLNALLDRAAMMVQACAPGVPAGENPGAWLGAAFAEAARAGRDKITIIASAEIASFGLWAEQLIAESTGKEGRGLIPVADEPLGPPQIYGADRLFVRLVAGTKEDGSEPRVEALAAAGQPLITLRLRDAGDLGSEFFRWEFAVAVAGAILQLNVFDQPNVQEAKDLTKTVLAESRPATTGQGIRWTGQPGATLADAIQALLQQVKAGDYVALLAYIPPSSEHDRALTAIRGAVAERLRVATTAGYGPRYLHSTGQLHKGGPNTGVFLEIVGDDPKDLPIPGADYTFGVLKQAQALGDYMALRNHGRRVLRVQASEVDQALAQIAQAVGAQARVR